MTAQTVGQRVSQLISHLGISKNAFAASLEKTATVIQHLVDERNKPGFDLLCKIFEVYPNVSKDWLLQGNGSMLLSAEAATPNGATASAVEEKSPAPAPQVPRPTVAPEPVAAAIQPAPSAAPPQPAPVVEAPVAPAPPVAAAAVPNQAPTIPAAPTPAVDPTASLQAALYAQQMAHQLALAEMRNQHLQEQQRLMQQMMDMMQRQLSR